MEGSLKRDANVAELVAMVPRKEKEFPLLSPHKTAGEIHCHQRAEELDKRSKGRSLLTPISRSTRTSTLQKTLTSIEKQAQHGAFSIFNREKNWGGTRSGIRKIVATRKRTMRKPSLVLYYLLSRNIMHV